MGDVPRRIRIGGLTRLEQRELADALPAERVDSAQEDIRLGGLHGDLATWQVVIEAYVPTLPLLAAWLLKRRKKSVVEVEIEIRSSDGVGWERRSVRIESSEQSAPDAEVLRQLTELTQLRQAVDGATSEPR
ncbi:hypothetical protein AQI88_38945 [Streptomyces cellostaticus]|uniref:Uncharacterized protein n=1 Tax=Streptomyces cellostaticus TaxID=67285 RepID=A0A101NBL1_9ACTN|nr:hypothetical protein [Streptomyces cellostaticus]KUM90135.1 hypothetical protein AQI88_38945 [Streptomyces cellostaticus]GHI10311.1 hypothetical protein Scel_86320 [Streptomyces cellostaticus]